MTWAYKHVSTDETKGRISGRAPPKFQNLAVYQFQYFKMLKFPQFWTKIYKFWDVCVLYIGAHLPKIAL